MARLVPHLYPMMLDVTAMPIVLVGGGVVAARKAGGLLEAGAARVRAVALDFAADFPAVAELTRKAYQSDDLAGAKMVFAATDSSTVNDQVVNDANARGIWVCRADGSQLLPGDFVTPAKCRSGELIFTVSTGSAALAARVRDEMCTRLDPAWAQQASALAVLRPMILASSLDPRLRRELLRDLAGETAQNVLTQTGLSGLCRWIADRHPQLSFEPPFASTDFS